MEEKHYDFFQNKLCEFYPCHPGADPETFSCLFCYCPLYALATGAGGASAIRQTGSRTVPIASGPMSGRIMGRFWRRCRRFWS